MRPARGPTFLLVALAGGAGGAGSPGWRWYPGRGGGLWPRMIFPLGLVTWLRARDVEVILG